MSLSDLPHIGAMVFGSALMIARPKLDTIMQVLSLRLQGGSTVAAGIPADPNPLQVTPNGIAIISVLGTLTNRTYGLTAMSGLTTYMQVSDLLAQAAANPAVLGILLDIDSNGGQAGGVFDLADQIFALRGIKPVYAIANDACLSAAYALACGAERVYVTQTGAVGSIGVVALHADQSGADEKAGVRYSTITAGDRKVDATPHAPLSADARVTLQAEVDRLYGLFTGMVARCRNLPDAQICAQQAGIFFGSTAVNLGLADQVGTFAGAFADLQNRISAPLPYALGGVLASTTTKKGSRLMPETLALTAEVPSASDAALREQLAGEMSALREQLANEISAKAAGAVTVTAETAQALATRLRAEAGEIFELCQIAGQVDLAAGYVRQGMSPATARKALLACRADRYEAAPVAPLDPNAAAGESPLIAAIKATYRREA
ncbi:MAG: S49 family peptidase [Rhodospirillaceae bacterium]